MDTNKALFLIAFMLILLLVVIAPLTMVLWNWLLPSITSGVITPVTYWQACGIHMLLGLLTMKVHYQS